MNRCNHPFLLPVLLGIIITGLGFFSCNKPICTREYLFEIPFEINAPDSLRVGDEFYLSSAPGDTMTDLVSGEKINISNVEFLTEIFISDFMPWDEGISKFDIIPKIGSLHEVSIAGVTSFQILWQRVENGRESLIKFKALQPGHYILQLYSILSIDFKDNESELNHVTINPVPCEEKYFLQYAQKSQYPDNNFFLLKESSAFDDFEKMDPLLRRAGTFAFVVSP